MKKWLKILLIAATALALGCVIFQIGFQLGFVAFLRAAGIGGAGDWTCDELPDPYEIWRLNAEEIILCERDGPYSAKNVVDSYVWKTAWNDELILAAQKPQRGSGAEESVYYALDVPSGELHGPFREQELSDYLEGRGLSPSSFDWKPLDQLKKTR